MDQKESKWHILACEMIRGINAEITRKSSLPYGQC